MRVSAPILLTILMIFTSSCRQGSETQAPAPSGPKAGATGGSDVGGGNTGESTEEEIRAAIKKAVEYMKDPRWKTYNAEARIKIKGPKGFYDQKPTLNINGTWTSPKESPTLSEEDKEFNSSFDLIDYILDPRWTYYNQNADLTPCGGNWGCLPPDERPENIKIREQSLVHPDSSYLDKVFNNIRYETEGYCPADDKDNADASVTSYDMDAQLCFSLWSLKRIPPESIEKQVLGLWVHELSHMHGHRELKAKKLQAIAMDTHYFLSTNQREPVSSIIDEKIKEFMRSHVNLRNGLLLVTGASSTAWGGVNLDEKLLAEQGQRIFIYMGEVIARAEDILGLIQNFPGTVKCMPYLDDHMLELVKSGWPGEVSVSFEKRLEMVLEAIHKMREDLPSALTMEWASTVDQHYYHKFFSPVFLFDRCEEGEMSP